MKLLVAAAAAALFAAPAFAQTGSGNPDSSRSTEEAPTTSGSVTDCSANPTAAQCDGSATTGTTMAPAAGGTMGTSESTNSDSAGSSTARSGAEGNGADTTAPAGGIVPGQTSN
ncbi:hypothetical protein [Jiella mangrovi]|uniref:Oxidoreductase n=1 Tax=Jiella mangrovi TaxID=2821407 RepID=A0ABS4BDD4_9HYPH|nr:hypothetical protein [Jiella mangrovi]MBP0614760.1 hypothetical protein [Jiella mangrovi]